MKWLVEAVLCALLLAIPLAMLSPTSTPGFSAAMSRDDHMRMAVMERRTQELSLLLPPGQPYGPEEERLLLCAAGVGNREAVELLLERGVSADARMGQFSALRMAAAGPNTEIVEMLLRYGADVNVGESPLIAAARCGRRRTIELLLQAGANINDVDSDGITALMRAAEHSDPATVKCLLQAGAQVNARDASGCTSLMLAAAAGKEENAAVLLAAGAERCD